MHVLSVKIFIFFAAFRFSFISLYFLITFLLPPVFSVGHAVAQLVEALRYRSEGRGFDSRWCHWNFSLT